MADRNEVIRIILEGRDKLSKELDGVRNAADKLDQSLQRLKRNKPDEFPLFGGGKASRGPGGQFVRKEDISLVDQMRQKVDQLNNSINVFKRNKVREGEFPLFGGGRAVRGDDGRFIRVQDVTLLEKAKNRLDAIDKALVRIRTRIRRGPLVEGEEAGAGATRLVRNAAGQFTRAEDLSFIRRLQREFTALRGVVTNLRRDTQQGLFLGARRTIDDLRRVGQFADQVKTKIRDALLGSGRTRTGVDPTTGKFISVADITTFGRFVRTIEEGGKRIVAANRKVAESQREIRQAIRGSFLEGLRTAKGTEDAIRNQIAENKDQLRERRAQLQREQELEKVALSAREDLERKALFRRLEDQREADAVEIEDLRSHLRTLGKTEEEEAERLATRSEIRRIQRERRLRESEERAALGATFQAERAGLRISQAGERRSLDFPDIKKIEEEQRQARSEFLATGSAIERMGKRAGLAFGDVVRGARAARSGIRNMDRDVNLVRNAFTRLGFAAGSVFKNFDQLVNLRWLFLTGILTIFFTLVTQIGTALVALASSAIQAGAALGGAFLSGIAQALPVVGLLAAALSRFNTVLDAVKLNEKLGAKAKDNVDQIRQAGQRLADAQYSVKKAMEGVKDAQYAVIQANKDLKNSYKDVKDATKELADAKIQAARDIVDANLEEKDAALSLKEAELGVLEAKQRLRDEEKKQRAGRGDVEGARAALKEAQERLKIARQQGDQSEISAAQQQVDLAQQSLNSILDQVDSAKNDLQDAKLGVERAGLTVEQARVRNRRAAADAKKARDEGIKGSDVVKQAQDQLKSAIDAVANSQRNVFLANRNVRDSQHQVAIALREVADARKDESDARKGQTQADKDAQKAFADLSPAEKKLFNSLKRLRKVFKDVFVGNSERDGILGPITEAIARFADTITKLLLDPKIQKAARNLAEAIADAFDEFRKFIASPEFKDALLFFTERATDNIPRVVQGMLNLAQAFLNIARVATPIFDRLLKGAVSLTGKLKDITSTKGEARRPEEGLGGRLGQVATLNQSPISRFLEGAEKHLDAWLKLSAAIINLIDAVTSSPAAGAGKTLIEDLTEQLNRFAEFIRDNPEKVQEFFDNAVESIENLSKVLGRLSAALIKSFSSKEFSDFAEFISEIIIPGLLLFIATLGSLSKILLAIIHLPVVGNVIKWALAILVAEKAFNKVFPVTQKFTDAIKKMIGGLISAIKYLVRPGGISTALDVVTTKATAAKDAVFKLGRTIADTATSMAKGFASGASKAKEAIVNMGQAALTAASRIGKALYLALTRVVSFIYAGLLRALLALRISIRLLISATVIGALIVAGLLLIENWDKVKAAAKKLADWLIDKFHAVVAWVKENWKKILVGALLAPFLPAGLVFLAILKFKDRVIGVFKTLGDAIIGQFKRAFNWVREKLTDLGGWINKKLASLPVVGRFFKTGGEADDKTQPVIIQVQPKDIAKANRIITHRAGGGVIPGHGVLDSVPAMLTPGEWVLNKEQQSRLASVLGVTAAQVRAMVFGTNTRNPPRTGTFGAGRGPGGQAAARVPNRGLPAGLSRGTPRKVINYSDFNLVSQTDDDGVEVWFLELANGTFGQVTSRDAARIQSSRGTWIPGYAKRSTAGFNQNIKSIAVGATQKIRSPFNLGGVVGSSAVQRFAEGGVVQAAGHGNTSSQKNITQNFEVTTQGETDWGYVMRLGAIHAQESF
jgi:hypothetical protein